jgi:hypothetical protein
MAARTVTTAAAGHAGASGIGRRSPLPSFVPPNAVRIAGVVAILLVINVGARLIADHALPKDSDPVVLALWSIVAMVLAVGVAAFVWTTRRRVPTVAGDLFFTVAASSVLVTLLAPLVSGQAHFSVGIAFRVLGLCAAMLTIGSAAGVLIAVAFGLDPTTRAWRSQAAKLRKPAQRPAPSRSSRT